MEIRFKFIPTTMDQISILMFLGQKGQHDLFSDHMAVSFVKGYVMLTWNLGSGKCFCFSRSGSKLWYLRAQKDFYNQTDK